MTPSEAKEAIREALQTPEACRICEGRVVNGYYHTCPIGKALAALSRMGYEGGTMSTPAALRGLANLHEDAAREPYKNPDVLTTIRFTVAAVRELAEIKEAAGELEEATREYGVAMYARGQWSCGDDEVTFKETKRLSYLAEDHAITLARAVVAERDLYEQMVRGLEAEIFGYLDERDALKRRV